MKDRAHFAGSTRINPGEVLILSGERLWEGYYADCRQIDALCGDRASELFAEPNLRRVDSDTQTVAWFSTQNDDPKPLATLDRSLRARVEQDLAARLEALRPAFADPELGERVGAMLNIADKSSIVAVGENALLLNWGVLPGSAAASREEFLNHNAEAWGPFLPAGISPRIPGQPWRYSNDGSPGQSPPRRQSGFWLQEPATKSAASERISARQARFSGFAIVPLSLLTAIFLAALLYLYWPGHLVFPQVGQAIPEAVADPAVIRSLNGSLESRIEELRTQLSREACTVDEAVLGVDLTSLGRLDGPANADLGAVAPLPGHGSSGQGPVAPLPPGAAPNVDAQTNGSLLQKLDAATVLILAPSGDMLTTGSGFFVSPTDVLTNRHVVEGAGQVFLASRALGNAVPAEIIASSSGSQPGTSDFALLRLKHNEAAAAASLPLATEIARLDKVVAAGFPSFVMQLDRTYRRILDGDVSQIASLQLVATQGSVMALPQAGSTQVITHSASISPGNSGGPLVDGCGRVVGINTFIAYDGASAQRLNFSLGSTDAIRFLAEHGVRPAVEPGSCVPRGAAIAAESDPGLLGARANP